MRQASLQLQRSSHAILQYSLRSYLRMAFPSLVEQPGLRRTSTFGEMMRWCCFRLVLNVCVDFLDHDRSFDAGNHLHRTAAVTAGLNVDVEDVFQALCPVHRDPPFDRRLILRFIFHAGCSARTPHENG